jgi:hypothetical protein
MSYPFLGSLDLFIFFLVGPRCASKSNVVGVLSMLWVKWFVSGLYMPRIFRIGLLDGII